MALSPGTRFGPYEVLSLIGEGGMGEVYRARDIRLGRDAALKVLPEAALADTERRDRFNLEARTLAALNHPNIVTIYGVEEIGSTACLAMELVDGQPLSASIPVGGVPPARLLSLAIQLADAVSAAHVGSAGAARRCNARHATPARGGRIDSCGDRPPCGCLVAAWRAGAAGRHVVQTSCRVGVGCGAAAGSGGTRLGSCRPHRRTVRESVGRWGTRSVRPHSTGPDRERAVEDTRRGNRGQQAESDRCDDLVS